jgi:Ni/Fe-hydrogenase subunit HybB-like protein
MVILGFVMNRMNIGIAGMESSAGVSYFPSWMEISITLSLVVIGFIIFGLAGKYLPLFDHGHEETRKVVVPSEEWVNDLRAVSQPN